MPSDFILSRRAFLIGCSVAASPLLSPVTFAATSGENRLVVIVLRGAMDGLDVLRPLGDRDYLALRPGLAANAKDSPALDDFYHLHPAAAPLLPLWQKGELAFAQAVATPYRNRSHFVGQDALENGTGGPDGMMTPGRDGWLNRALTRIAGVTPETGVSIGQQRLLIMDGGQDTDHWYPVTESQLSTQGQQLLDAVNAADDLFAEPYAESQTLVRMTNGEKVPRAGIAFRQLGTYVAERLTGPSRIASFSIGGWDSHKGQAKLMSEQLTDLSDVLLAMKDGLGGTWSSTLVLAMTEFGRTARENGTGGTDHGTGGMMIAAGGALNGGRVFGTWPGLGEAALLGERDLMPTGDVRAYAGHALRGMFGVDADAIESLVFPGLDMGRDPGLLL